MTQATQPTTGDRERGPEDSPSNAAAVSDPAAPVIAVPISAGAPGRKPTGPSIIDPVNRIEGHLRIDMQVKDGFVEDVWITGGLFRGMELVLENRHAADAAYITQRICGVCPVSHSHAASIAGEKSYGLTIPNGARILRNIIEGAQFLHSHILWFYNLAALDYVNPLNALNADISEAVKLADAAGTTEADFAGLINRLKAFAENGQLSIFSGNWFDSVEHDGSSAYKLPPELDLIATQHYLEALEMQATASEISGIIGGKMPHIMTLLPGGTAFVPTAEKLDDLLFRVKKLADWVAHTMIPDTLAIVPYYMDEFTNGSNEGNYLAWGVFESESFKPEERYLPGGIWSMKESKYQQVTNWDEQLITETTIHSFYDPAIDDGSPVNPRQGITAPLYKDEYILPNGTHPAQGARYTWDKAPRYDDLVFEAGGLSRLLVAYNRGVPFVKDNIDNLLSALGAAGRIDLLNSTMGRTGARNIETLYIANLMVDWVNELIAAVKEGNAATFAEPETRTGEGAGMWEAPRGALYHYMKIKNDIIQKYQIIIPTTWNISPRDALDRKGPMEQALMGMPVEDVNKPIHALRAVHSFDPCVACAVHVSEPATGKSFTVVTSPWGVK
ncbi:MAG: nickel-dependent hydrogenase large subunit [Coriobacteriales bacterium]|jgi:hydrogenase large subunit|nr:nickel-dependent hydrogenase large subunit [Coriobacteriales bacterium]